MTDEICNAFAKETGTDTALAQFYLQDVSWDLDKALKEYRQNDHVSINDMTIPKYVFESEDLKFLRVFSWNVDGTEKKDIKRRMSSVISTIQTRMPEVVFFQELVPDYERTLREALCSKYIMFFSDENTDTDVSYYCGVLVKKHPDIHVLRDSFKVISFENSVMDRHLVVLNVKLNDVVLKLMTSHLESTADHSGARKSQLLLAFDEMRAQSDLTIFAGDLNLRDKEVIEIGGLPHGITDVWESTGKRKEIQFTWDPRRNVNANEYCPHGLPQRFDRMFLYSGTENLAIKPVYFELEGIVKVDCGVRYPSDHWAIIGHFQLV